MAVAIRSSSNSTGYTTVTGGADISNAVPTGTAAGDLLVAVCANDGTSVSTTAGWTKVASTPTHISVFWKVATGSEPTIVFRHLSSSAPSAEQAVFALTGANTTSPIAPVASTTAATSTSHVAPTLTPSGLGMLFAAYECTGGATTYTPPAGMTERVDVNDGWLTLGVDTVSLASTAATGTKTATASASRAYESLSFVVNDAAAVPGFTGSLALSGAGTLAASGSAVVGVTVTGTVYVDPVGGSDSNNGTSTATAFRTVTKINASTLQPGATVLFARGQTYTTPLTVKSSGTSGARITIGAYGTGALPVFDGGAANYPITVTGNFVTVQDVQVQNAGKSDRVGLGWYGTDGLATGVTATGNAIGAQAYAGAHRLRITACNLSNNTVVIDPDGVGSAAGSTDDYGASGLVVLAADNVEIDHNVISGNVGPSGDFGQDGSAVEIYGAIGAVVHHNVCQNNQTFSELGDTRTSGTIYHNNLITSNINGALGVNAQGTGAFGPVLNTQFHHNTVVLTGTSGTGLVADTGATFAAHNNIIVAPYIGYTAQKIDEGNNVFVGGANGNDIQSTANAGTGIASTSVLTQTSQFVSASNYRLVSGATAINRGVDLGYTTDLDGNPRKQGAAPDAGAYEFGVVAFSGTVALTGSGTLSLSGVPKPTGARALSGSGTLTLSGVGATSSFTGTLALAASGSLSLAGRATVTGALGLSGSGSLSLSGVRSGGGAVLTASGLLSLSGSGVLTLTGTAAITAKLALVGELQLTLTGSGTWPTWVFSTPTMPVPYQLEGRLWATHDQGVTVFRVNGQWFTAGVPNADQIAAADRVYLGGRTHVLTQDLRDELRLAGFGRFLDPLAPDENVYPSDATFPSDLLFPQNSEFQ